MQVQDFLKEYILDGKKILECVKHHVIRYELQDQNLLHPRILLWVDSNDVNQVTIEIMAYILAIMIKRKKIIASSNIHCNKKKIIA